ncbi:Gibberellin regulated protein [Macleaya cordata]|uniref:Gibberellin regulated protein n=1 Tax=Macleaya cordata TaxID=56857 RepID=A0A200Q364_MACCD|nr:Gibberellin regulated protein [Macleaya cordata]
MAISKALVASLVFSLFLLHLVEAFDSNQAISSSGAQRSLLGIDCGAACKARCQLSSRPNLCKRACGTCCYRCKCVPKGTSGNLEDCSCYAKMTTHGGKRKCP